MTLGVAARLVPALERHAAGFRRLLRFSFPIVAGLVLVLAATSWGGDRIREWRQGRRPLPASGSPNVLLVVLDTVAAEHLSLYGYGRPTSPAMVELAERGIRFDRAQATSSWTLPSHASMFTGRWPHELSAGWLTRWMAPSRLWPSSWVRTVTPPPALSAIAGIVRPTPASSAASPLIEDYIFPRLTACKAASLVDRTVDGIRAMERFLEDRLDIDVLRVPVERLFQLVNADRKEAAGVNREFLDWLARRRQPERPFFAFLNYYDAHSPYDLPSSEDSPLREPVRRPARRRHDPGMVVARQDGDLPARYRARPRRLR